MKDRAFPGIRSDLININIKFLILEGNHLEATYSFSFCL